MIRPPTVPRPRCRLRIPGRALAGAALLSLCLAGVAAEAASAYDPQLRRYPYLSDAAAGGVTVNWATDRVATTATVKWGRVGTEACTANTVTATRTSITVGTTAEYQWTARLGIPAGTAFCYRVYGGAVDLLGTDPSPQSTTQLPSGSTAPFSFAVLGDWGLGKAAGNPGQAGVLAGIAASGARFAVTTGDTGYPSGSQANYGDLVQTGDNVSGVFGPQGWTKAGASIPLFSTAGNHGFSNTFLSMWPSGNTAAASGGSWKMDTYCCTNGTSSASYPSAWYAFDQGNTRFYVLTAVWPDGNVGTATNYKNDYDNHWTPTSPEYQWLERDLATHPAQVRMAFFHHPLWVDNSTEPSDVYLQGPNSLEGLLNRYGVALAFNGHAHVYQRNKPDAGGLVAYVSGGGGAAPEPVNHCSANDAYAIGWSNSSSTGSACGAAARPTSINQVHHWLLVTVNGKTVTVRPTDANGTAFDAQTYNFATPPPPPPDTTPPTAPATVTPTVVSQTRVDLSWSASTDNIGVAGYKIKRNGADLTTVTSGRTYSDTTAVAGTTYTYSVAAFDAKGNTSAATAAAPVTTPTATGSAIAFVRDATGSTPGGTTFDVPIASTAGDALVASVAIQAGATAAVSTITDSAGGTWTKGPIGFLSGFSTRAELWYRTAGAPVTSVTVTLNTAKAASANVAEFSGIAAAGALDASATTGTSSSTTAPFPPVTTTSAKTLVVGAINYPGAATSTLNAVGFNPLSSFTVSTVNGRAAYRIVSTPGTWSGAWTLSAAANSGGVALALKGA
jgi:hypothetical protein